MGSVIQVKHLRKVYGSLVAIDDLSFEVEKGEIFGMVGPNGAGKTTTIECIEGLRHPDGGTVSILGLDPYRNGFKIRNRIGVQLQESLLPDNITVWEVMKLFASFYTHQVDLNTILDYVGLFEKRNVYFRKLSGGLKHRLFIALALVNEPEIVFLDELTTGLDPQARRDMWKLVKELRDQGRTIFLTTHFMEEAEHLCDRVAIIKRGRLVALDSPENLIQRIGAESRIVFNVDQALALDFLQSLPGVRLVERLMERIIVHGKGDKLLSSLVSALDERGVRFQNLRTEQPTLEDVYLFLTGGRITNSE